MKHAIAKADVLLEALPYLRAFSGKTFVIKFGGSLQEQPGGEESFIQDVLFLRTAGINPVVVHGGGKEISQAQKKLGIETRFVHGLRVTDAKTMRVAARVLGKVNSRMVGRLRKMGAGAAGFSGLRGAVLRARKLKVPGGDLGHVGTPAGFFPAPLRMAQHEGKIPILSSVAVGSNGELYNVNADDAAGALAARLKASKLVLMTDVPGIQDRRGRLISSLKAANAKKLVRTGVISRGMIPKVRACLRALARGVGKAHIVDGRHRHSLLLEIFTTKGVGTEIVR